MEAKAQNKYLPACFGIRNPTRANQRNSDAAFLRIARNDMIHDTEPFQL